MAKVWIQCLESHLHNLFLREWTAKNGQLLEIILGQDWRRWSIIPVRDSHVHNCDSITPAIPQESSASNSGGYGHPIICPTQAGATCWLL